MSVQLKILYTTSTGEHVVIIPNASEFNDGVMTKEQVKKLNSTPPPTPPSPSIFMFGAHDVGDAIAARYLPPGFIPTAPTNIIEVVMPHAGTLNNMFVRHNSADGGGQTLYYTVVKNTVDTALTVNLASGAVGTGSDIINSVTVLQGDRIAVRVQDGDGGIGTGEIDVTVAIEFTSMT